VPFDPESARGEAPQVSGAARHVEHAPAPRALEVVVVNRLRGLVARRLAGKRDHVDRAFGDK